MKDTESNWIGSWYSYRFDVRYDTTSGKPILTLDSNFLIRTPIQIYSHGKVVDGMLNVKASWNEIDLEGPAKQMGDFFYIILDDDIPHHNENHNKNKIRKKRITLTVHNKPIRKYGQNTEGVYLSAITNTFIYGSIRESTPIGVPVILEKISSDLEFANQESQKISFDEAPEIVKNSLRLNKNFISIEHIRGANIWLNKKVKAIIAATGLAALIGVGMLLNEYTEKVNESNMQKKEIKNLKEYNYKFDPILNNLGFLNHNLDSRLQELIGIWISYINSPETWSVDDRKDKTGSIKNGTATIFWEFTKNQVGGLNIKRYGGSRDFEGYATINHNAVVFYIWEKGNQDAKPRFSIVRPVYEKENSEFGKCYLLIDAAWSYNDERSNTPMPFIEPMLKLDDVSAYKIDTSYFDDRNRFLVFSGSNPDTTITKKYPKYLNKKEIAVEYPNNKVLNNPFLLKYINKEPNYIKW